MNQDPIHPARWRISSIANPPDTSPAELAEPGEHLRLRQLRRGKLFEAGNVANVLDGFLAPRFVSTLVIVTVLTVGACMVL